MAISSFSPNWAFQVPAAWAVSPVNPAGNDVSPIPENRPYYEWESEQKALYQLPATAPAAEPWKGQYIDLYA